MANCAEMKEDDLFSAIEAQAKEGVDFMTVHTLIQVSTESRHEHYTLAQRNQVKDIH